MNILLQLCHALFLLPFLCLQVYRWLWLHSLVISVILPGLPTVTLNSGQGSLSQLNTRYPCASSTLKSEGPLPSPTTPRRRGWASRSYVFPLRDSLWPASFPVNLISRPRYCSHSSWKDNYWWESENWTCFWKLFRVPIYLIAWVVSHGMTYRIELMYLGAHRNSVT